MSEKVALVTGASSGIGRETALALQRRGFRVYGAARRVERMADLGEKGIEVLALDVIDEESARTAIARIQEESGRLDVLVNNAGYGSYGAVEDVPLAEGRRQFDVNVFGPIRLIRLAVPLMRAQHSGRIVNVTSVGGKIHTPFGAWYHGTKFALEGMSDVLRIELRRFGIDVIVIEPGTVKTEWGDVAIERLRSTSGTGLYAAEAKRLEERMMTGAAYERASDPAVIARVIAKAATVTCPRTRYPAGRFARSLVTLRWILPDRLFDRLITASLG